MAVTQLSATTLAAACGASDLILTVASTTGIAAGSYLAIQQELILVNTVPTSATVTVQRGMGGTDAVAHANLYKVFFGAASVFGAVNSDGFITLNGSDQPALPTYALPLGTMARDQAGNEYVMCDSTFQCYGRQPVAINSDFTISAVGTTGRGPVGVAVEPGTSDQYIWVQVYGRCLMQISMGTTGPSPSDAANGPTTLSTSAQTRFICATSVTSPACFGWTSDPSTGGFIVKGMYVATDASPADVSVVTAATSATGFQIGVILDYPFIVYELDVPGT